MIKGLGYLSVNGTERAGVAHPGEEKALGDLSSVCECLMGGVKKTEPGSFQWCLVTGQEVVGIN